MYVRPLITGIAFASALFAPPWMPMICAGALALRWRAWEVLPLGMLIDMLYLPAGQFFLGIPFPATLAALVLLWGFEPLRRQLMAT